MTEKVREIERRGYAAGLKLLRAQVRHLGTEQNLEIMQSIYEYLKEKIEMSFKTEVEDLLTEKTTDGLKVLGVQLKGDQKVFADKVVITPGRDGSTWLKGLLKIKTASYDQ